MTVREIKEQLQKTGGKDELIRQKLYAKIQEENKKPVSQRLLEIIQEVAS